MTIERMLELQLLTTARNELTPNDITSLNYDFDKMQDRLNELVTEFLSPYVIDSDSKE